MPHGQFEEKVAIITGGGSGIGRETALRLACKGARIVIVDRNRPATKMVVEQINTAGGQAVEHVLDLNDDIDFSIIPATAISAFGPPDILVNSAGMGINRLSLDTSKELWNKVLRTNLDTCFFCSQAVASEMSKRQLGGRIVNISSHAAFFGGTGQVAYAASKAAMLAVTRVMAIELAEHGITVNAIAPGPVTTPMSSKHPVERTTAWMNALPIQRYGTVDDIAAATLFFCSDESSHITGQTLCVDGGFSSAGLMIRKQWAPN